ncbi:MAG: hypothetical protein HC880_11370 [Bacteroidia bacterium]|nr:hypothetical protein [Bacteroidia bacterium]
MAENATDNISYYLSIKQVHQDFLGAIRHWGNLNVAFEDDQVWVKDLTNTQLNERALKTIPYKTLYYPQAAKLFLVGSHLPSRNIPALPWKPIESALPVRLPSFNHNYFGISPKLKPSLVSSAQEMPAAALICALDTLKDYLTSAPAVRLQPLQWAILEPERAFILGKPLLPLPGEVYWANQHFLLAPGYTLAFPGLVDALNERLNPEGNHWVIWEPDGQYFLINKNMLRPLSRSSFRLSIKS